MERKFISPEKFKEIHSKITLLTHDVAAINYRGGLLLVKRDNYPEKESWWPVVGLVYRGVLLEESLKRKVKEECNLEIEGIKEVGFGRTLFETDPFGHWKGTDTFVIMYFANGFGEVKLDNLHSDYKIVKFNEYFKIREKFHPYVQEIMEKSFPLI